MLNYSDFHRYKVTDSPRASESFADESLKSKLVQLSHEPIVEEIVMFCDPTQLPYFAKPLLSLLKRVFSVRLSVHYHSTVPTSAVTAEVRNFSQSLSSSINSALPELNLVLIWRYEKGNSTCCLKYARRHEIVGQVNVVRCLGRLIEQRNPELLRYESLGATFANQVDDLLRRLEDIEPLNQRRVQQLCRKEKGSSKSRYLLGEEISIVDVFLEN